MSEKSSPPYSLSGREIPNRKIADISNLPTDYSTTPGGSIFSTTPGGTRIFYQREFLMKFRDSPLAKTPPVNMANIPGVTSPGQIDFSKENGIEQPKSVSEKVPEENPQFEMDI